MPPLLLTHSPYPHVLTNVNAFSSDSRWIVYDIRSMGGNQFDGQRIERVNVDSGQIEVLYTGDNGANVGVATYSPTRDEVVFIRGPEHPTPDFSYGAARRQGVIVDIKTAHAQNLDARDLTPPFTPGALRGGTHVHVFSPDGAMVSSTYEDYLLESLGIGSTHDRNQRTVAVSVLGKPVWVNRDHPRNHDGASFTVVVTATVNEPVCGSDEINRAFEEGWVGTNGYLKPDGTRQSRALAFQGSVITSDGQSIREVFLVDLPDDLSRAGLWPVQGTPTTRPAPPAGCVQRRLTFTAGRRFPGIQGPRHWMRSSPEGARIAFLMKDDTGIVQLFTISPNGGDPIQLTHNISSIASAFSWSPDGRWIAHIMDNRVCVTDSRGGATIPLMERVEDAFAPRSQACVFSPTGKYIAFVAPTDIGGQPVDQIWLIRFSPPSP